MNLFPALAALIVTASLTPSASAQDTPDRHPEVPKLREKPLDAHEGGRDREAGDFVRRARELRGKAQPRRMHKAVERANQGHGGEGGEPGERIEHVRQAIRHLRAAGMDKPAERIEQVLRGMMRAAAEPRDRESQPGAPELQNAVRDLNAGLGALREHTEKLTREVEKLREEGQRVRGEGEKREHGHEVNGGRD